MTDNLRKLSNKYILIACILLCALAFSSITFFEIPAGLVVLVLLTSSTGAAIAVGNKSLLFKSLFFFVPLSLTTSLGGGIQMQFPTEILIVIFSLLLLFSLHHSIVFYKKLLSHPISKIILLEIFWLLLCSCFSELKEVSFKYTLVRISYVAVFYVVMIQWLQQFKKPQYFFLIYALGFIVPVLNALRFHASYNFSHSVSYIMPRPFFNDHTVYGACLAFLLPALLILTFHYKRFFRNRSILLILLPLLTLILIAEYFSFSRASWLSLAFCALLFIAMRFRISASVFITLILITGAGFYVKKDYFISKMADTKALSNKEDIKQTIGSITNIQTDASNKERLNRWKCAIRMGNDKPLLGFGPRTYKFMYGSYQVRKDMTYISTFNGNKGSAHSEFLGYFAECGWIGMILHFFFFLIPALKGIDLVRKCKSKTNRLMAIAIVLGFFTYFVHGFFNAFMEEEKMSSLVFMSMAGIYFIEEMEKNSEEISNKDSTPVHA